MNQSVAKSKIGDIPAAPMTKWEAEHITNAIKVAVETLWELLLEAHERKAWKALGYATWEAYIASEFDMSRNYSYRLLNQGRVIRALEEASGVAQGQQITERAARDIKPHLAEVTEEIRTRVEQGADPVETTYEVIEAKRAERKAEPEPEPEIEDDEPDMLAELEAANREIQRQQQLIESLQKDDLAAEVAALYERYGRLEGRLNQLMTTSNEAQRQATYYGKLLKKIRAALGVEQTQQILPKIKELVGGAQ